jgi:hypothetical protein
VIDNPKYKKFPEGNTESRFSGIRRSFDHTRNRHSDDMSRHIDETYKHTYENRRYNNNINNKPRNFSNTVNSTTDGSNVTRRQYTNFRARDEMKLVKNNSEDYVN